MKRGPELNVLKPNLRISIQTLLQAGKGQREISRVIGVDPRTVRRIAREAKSPGVATGFSAGKVDADAQNAPPRPPARKPAATPSACEIHREWIEAQVLLGRNAMSIYQDLVGEHGFTHALQLGQALRGRAQGPRTGALRRARGLARRRSASGLRRGCTDATGEREISPTVFVRDDAQVLGQELSQGRLESGSGKLGAAARGSVPNVRWIGPICRARQFKAGRDCDRICTSRRSIRCTRRCSRTTARSPTPRGSRTRIERVLWNRRYNIRSPRH